MQVKKIEHIGIAVRSIEKALEFYEGVLGLKCYNIEEVADQKVKTAFLKVGEVKLELLESTAADGPVAKFIEKRGEGIHHLAFEVEDIDSELRRLSGLGYQLIHQTPKDGADNKRIAFLHPKSTNGVLIELCQEKS